SLAVWAYRAEWLPEQVPTHWGLYGEPDARVPQDEMFWSLMIMPLALLGWAGLTVLLPWLSPVHFKVEPFRSTYDYIMGLIGLLLAYLGGVILAAQMEWIKGDIMVRWLAGGMFVAFALLGNVLGKVKRNFWVGVRTPWTLASDVVWERTHRLAAWLFTGGAGVGRGGVLLGSNPPIPLPPFPRPPPAPGFFSPWRYQTPGEDGPPRPGGQA